MRATPIGWFVYALSLSIGIPTFALEPVHTDSESSRWNLAAHSEVLKESSTELTLEEVSVPGWSEVFEPLAGETINFGIQRATFWFRFAVANPRANRTDFFVEIDNPRIKRADFFVLDQPGEDRWQWSGTILPFSKRSLPYRNPVFKISLDPGEVQTLYCRVYKRGSYRFSLTLWEAGSYVRSHTLRMSLEEAFYGSLLVMLVVNLILFTLFRDRSFLFLGGMITFTVLYLMAYQRIDQQYFFPDSTELPSGRISLFIGLAISMGFLYSREFLEIWKYSPRWDKAFQVYAGLALLMGVDALVGHLWADWMVQFVGGTTPIVLLIGAVIGVRQGHRYAWIYLAAWGMVIGSMFLFLLLGIGLIPQSFVAENAWKIAFPFSLALHSIALWERFRQIQEDHHANLDHQVKERTKELTEALENVKTLRGLIPICCSCKNIRNDQGYWMQVENYIMERSEAGFTHGICPECATKLYDYPRPEDRDAPSQTP